jgi:isochorismate hydrolase
MGENVKERLDEMESGDLIWIDQFIVGCVYTDEGREWTASDAFIHHITLTTTDIDECADWINSTLEKLKDRSS